MQTEITLDRDGENAVLLSAGRLGAQQHVVWERDEGTVVAATNDR